MDRIYDDAKDKNVAAVIIYAKGSDGKAWKDADGTDQYLRAAEIRLKLRLKRWRLLLTNFGGISKWLNFMG